MKSEAEVKAALDAICLMNNSDDNCGYTAIKMLKWVLDEK